LRIPVTPIGTPSTILSFDQFVERAVFVAEPSGHFVEPRRPFLIDGEAHAPRRAAPQLGADTGSVDWAPRPQPAPRPPADLPLRGVRVVDFTAFWAGPSATLLLAALGADVIKIESIQRPDGMRFSSAKTRSVDGWWEWGAHYQACNANKRGITLDLNA